MRLQRLMEERIATHTLALETCLQIMNWIARRDAALMGVSLLAMSLYGLVSGDILHNADISPAIYPPVPSNAGY